MMFAKLICSLKTTGVRTLSSGKSLICRRIERSELAVLAAFTSSDVTLEVPEVVGPRRQVKTTLLVSSSRRVNEILSFEYTNKQI